MTELGLAILVTIGLAVFIPFAALGIARVLGTKNPTEAKLSTYESGITRTVGTTRQRFTVKFYLVTILFILFDIEAVFMYPWAVTMRAGGWTSVLEMVAFVGVLVAGYLYIIWKGALEWD